MEFDGYQVWTAEEWSFPCACPERLQRNPEWNCITNGSNLNHILQYWKRMCCESWVQSNCSVYLALWFCHHCYLRFIPTCEHCCFVMAVTL